MEASLQRTYSGQKCVFVWEQESFPGISEEVNESVEGGAQGGRLINSRGELPLISQSMTVIKLDMKDREEIQRSITAQTLTRWRGRVTRMTMPPTERQWRRGSQRRP